MDNHQDRSGSLVPYITAWSEEQPLPTKIVEVPRFGIMYSDEAFAERDQHGVLWRRIPSQPGRGRSDFGRVHSLRQRRAMRQLLCQVCAGPADQNDQGTLWLLPDSGDDWPSWPEHMACPHPPVCVPCAQISLRACPALRKAPVAIRVSRRPIVGVLGVHYQPGEPRPVAVAGVIANFDDPAIRWTCAEQLVRELIGCTLIDLDELCDG